MELIFQNASYLACHVNRSTREDWKARVCVAGTHYFESEIITSWLCASSAYIDSVTKETVFNEQMKKLLDDGEQ